MCKVCGRPDDTININKGTGICNEICRKIWTGDIELQRALDYLWSINTSTSLENYAKLKGDNNGAIV